MHTVWCGIVDYEAIVKLSDGFNGADLRNVCTESGKCFIMDCYSYINRPCCLGMFAIREERDYCVQEDFMKAVRKVQDMKKLETKMDYDKV